MGAIVVLTRVVKSYRLVQSRCTQRVPWIWSFGPMLHGHLGAVGQRQDDTAQFDCCIDRPD